MKNGCAIIMIAFYCYRIGAAFRCSTSLQHSLSTSSMGVMPAWLRTSTYLFKAAPSRALKSKASRGGAGSDGTRVFVSGIPREITWENLKDHFRCAGEVVYASVSVDQSTGLSKGVGIVQYETPEEASNAIRIIRDYPLMGETLFVREDMQDRSKRRADGRFVSRAQSSNDVRAGSGLRWTQCEDDLDESVTPEAAALVCKLLEEREAFRRRADFERSDHIRDTLQRKGVKMDDRRKQWWRMAGVPESVKTLNPEGRWNKGGGRWKCLDSDILERSGFDEAFILKLLAQRDEYRAKKDFASADALYERLKNNFKLIIDDKKRTWRIWREEKAGS